MDKNRKNQKNNEKKTGHGSPKCNVYAIFCRILHAMILVTWSYSVCIFMMTYLIPRITASLAIGMGVSYESKMLDILGLWLLPSCFLILMLVILTTVSIKVLHDCLKKNFDKSIQKHYLQKQTKMHC